MGTRTLSALGRRALSALTFAVAMAGHRVSAEPVRDATGSSGLVAIRAPACETDIFSAGEFRRLLSIELLGDKLHVIEGDASRADAPEVVVEVAPGACQSESREVAVLLRSGPTDKPVRRTIGVADATASARPRTLALAVAEVIREARQQWRDESSPSAVIAKASPSAESRAPHDVSVARKEVDPRPKTEPALQHHDDRDLALSATDRLFTSELTSLFGGQLSATAWEPLPSVRLRIDAGAMGGRITDTLGEVNLWTLSGGVAALAVLRARPAVVLGPRMEVGYAHASGTPRGPGVSSDRQGRALAAASVVGGVRVQLRGSWSAELEIEAGTMVGGLDVQIDDRRVSAIRGPFAGARGGVGYAF